MWSFHVNIYKETIFNCWRAVLEMIKFWKAHPQWKSYHVHLVTSECCTTKLWEWHFQFDNLVYWFCRYTYLVSKCQHKILSHLCLLTSIELRWPYDSLIFIVKSWYVERQSHDCLIFNGNPDTWKDHLYIATGNHLPGESSDEWICFMTLSFSRLLEVCLVTRQNYYFNLYSWVKILLYTLIPVFTVRTFPHNFYPILLFPGVCFLRSKSNRSMIKICNWQIKHRIKLS